MKNLNPSLRAVLGASLAASAVLAAAQIPTSEMALIACEGQPGAPSRGEVHRVNLTTGAYLGSFGAGNLSNPTALAVQPSTGLAYIADGAGIKRFDPVSGAFVSVCVRNSKLGGKAMALRFSPMGDLVAIVAPSNSMTTYKIVRLNPTNASVLATSSAIGTDYKMHVSIGFRPGGMVEAFNSLNGKSYADLFTPNLLNATHPFTNGVDLGAIRTTNDAFVWCEMITSFDSMMNGGVGTFGTGKTFAVDFPTPYALFAEGADLKTYCFMTMQGKDRMMRLDTSLQPVAMPDGPMDAFAHGKPMDMAIYTQS